MRLTPLRHTSAMTTPLFAGSILLIAAICLLFAPADAASQESHLLAGIRLYNSGHYNEALAELNDQIEDNPRCPQAYYYAARIRIAREQYARAEKNLAAAFRDSTDFHDARALMALVYLNLGREEDALAAWEQFTRVEGTLETGRQAGISDIMFPEEYRDLVEQKRLEQERIEKERLAAEKKERERLAEEKRGRAELERRKQEVARMLEERRIREIRASEERVRREQEAEEARQAEAAAANQAPAAESPDERSPAPADPATAEHPDSGNPGFAEEPSEPLDDAAIAAPLEDLRQRIRATIRTGFVGIAIIILVLVAIIAGIVYGIRKRRLSREESGFSEEVERLMLDREFELSEEQAIHELEARKRGIIMEARNIRETVMRPELPEEPPVRPAEPLEEEPPYLPEELPVSEQSRDTFITEEVKGLVSRLYREGKLPEEIANIADLTKTEVDLILAVRERHMSDLIADIHAEDNPYNRDELLQAIHTLAFEGAGTREIARKLNISISEVELATSILEMKKQASL